MSYVSNNEEWRTTDAGRFCLTQRNAGYADNDGRWVVSQVGEHEYDHLGTLYRTREGKVLGVFDSKETALAAVQTATQLPKCRVPLN